MEQVPVLLLVALALVFVAWRAAGAQNRRLAAARSEVQERNSFTLVAREAPGGQGFDVVDAEGHVVDTSALRFDDHGLETVDVDAFLTGADAGEHPDFAAGLSVQIMPADDDLTRLEVWNSAMTHRAGVLPRRLAHAFDDTAELAVSDCLVLWEHLDGPRRTGLRLLLIREDMHFDE
jgi:hypothetical protein